MQQNHTDLGISVPGITMDTSTEHILPHQLNPPINYFNPFQQYYQNPYPQQYQQHLFQSQYNQNINQTNVNPEIKEEILEDLESKQGDNKEKFQPVQNPIQQKSAQNL